MKRGPVNPESYSFYTIFERSSSYLLNDSFSELKHYLKDLCNLQPKNFQDEFRKNYLILKYVTFDDNFPGTIRPIIVNCLK